MGSTVCTCIRRARIGPVLVPDVDCKATHAGEVRLTVRLLGLDLLDVELTTDQPQPPAPDADDKPVVTSGEHIDSYDVATGLGFRPPSVDTE